MTPAPIAIDLEAIAHNLREFTTRVPVPIIPVVKADAYGHGAVQVARTLETVAPAELRPPLLAVADAAEAAALRAAGITMPLLCWLLSPSLDWEALRAIPDLHVGVSALHELALLADAAPQVAGRVDRDRAVNVHLKLDTGLGRNGVRECEWRAIMAQAAQLERAGRIRVVGIMSHVSGTSPADDAAQLDAFTRGVTQAIDAGLRPQLVHIAATAAGASYDRFTAQADAWTRREADGSEYRPQLAARLGIALYGLDPLHPDRIGVDLQPALQLRTQLSGFGAHWVTELGQVDGLPPTVSSLHLTDDAGDRWRVGRVGSTHTTLVPETATSATELTAIGPGSASADEWARAANTINYEITTRLAGSLRANDEPAVIPVTPKQPRLAPKREFVVDLDLIAARLAGGTGALRKGDRARPVADRHLHEHIDISADAYGFGADAVAALAIKAGKTLVARTERDVDRLRARGFEVDYEPTAGRETRVAYGFHTSLAAQLRSELIQVKRVAAGQAVSYGYTWRASRPTTLGLVPLGYADAIPRAVGGRASLFVNGIHAPIVGRVAMDQMVVDLGDTNCASGMVVHVWGGEHGASIQQWCEWSGLTPTAVTATLGSRVTRRYLRDGVERDD